MMKRAPVTELLFGQAALKASERKGAASAEAAKLRMEDWLLSGHGPEPIRGFRRYGPADSLATHLLIQG